MSHRKGYPALYDRMRLDEERSTTQAARLPDLLEGHGSAKSLGKEAEAGAIATISGFAQVGSGNQAILSQSKAEEHEMATGEHLAGLVWDDRAQH